MYEYTSVQVRDTRVHMTRYQNAGVPVNIQENELSVSGTGGALLGDN